MGPERRVRDHVEALQISALLEGHVSPEQRHALLHHLALCPQCSAWIMETWHILIASDQAPPPVFYHPIERFLAPLRAVFPWPAWQWHFWIHLFTPFLWIVCIDVRTLPHLVSPFWTLAPWPASLVMTTYFLWLQEWNRTFVRDVWRTGIPSSEIRTLLHRYWLPLQGRTYGGGWLFLGLALLTTLTNTLLIPPGSWKAGFVVGATGLYGLTVTIAMYWSWGWGGWWWHGVASLFRRYPEQGRVLLPQARDQALIWLLVASGSMLWHLSVAVHLAGTYRALRLYGVMITFLLCSLWGGYVMLEQSLLRSHRAAGGEWQALVRIAVALLMALIPVGVT